MCATIISAMVTESIKALSSREQWPDCAISQLTIQPDHFSRERHSVIASLEIGSCSRELISGLGGKNTMSMWRDLVQRVTRI